MQSILSPYLMLTVISQGVIHILGHENHCPPPKVFPNSDVQWSDRTLGAYATYSCREGYKMVGPAETVIRYCDQNGRWRSSITPECIRIQCQSPKVPANGNVTYLAGRGEYGTVLFYQCAKFYKRVGPISAKCLSDGTWSRSAPICKIRCNSPVLQNGTVSHLNDHVCLEFSGPGDDRLDWRTAQAQCQDNMGSLVIIREEDAQATISGTLMDIIDVGGSDGFWIGAEERLTSAVQATRNWQWVDGSLVDDVFWGPDEPTSSTTSLSRGRCVDLDSMTGYEWNDNNCSLQQRYICQFGESGLCGDPGVPLYGSRTLLGCDDQTDGEFLEGCLITFQCDPGYRLVGDSSATCESLGDWSNALPTCERRLCNTRPPPDYLAETVSNSYRGISVYRCPADSYPAQGDAFTYCRQNGLWSASNLLCILNGTDSATPQSTIEPDWTFIGIVGALGILLLVAIFIIITLAAIRNKNLNSRRKYARPLPGASTAGRKRRSVENTYYSIRRPVPSPPAERSGQVELKQMKRLSDAVGDSSTGFSNLTYDQSPPVLMNDDYLEPIKVVHQEGGGKMPQRLSSGEYENPMSPRNENYIEVVADDGVHNEKVEDEDGLLNNYIILLPDDEGDEEVNKIVGDLSQEKQTVDEKEVDVEEDKSKEKSAGDTSDVKEPLDSVKDSVMLPKNGLEIPALNYSKNEGFGSTVEL